MNNKVLMLGKAKEKVGFVNIVSHLYYGAGWNFVSPVVFTTDVGTYNVSSSELNGAKVPGRYVTNIKFTMTGDYSQGVRLICAGDEKNLGVGLNYDFIINQTIKPGVVTNYAIPEGSVSKPNGWYMLDIMCYLRGTKVTLADGTTKAVEDLTYDDELLVWDFDNGCFAKAKPLWVTKPRLAKYFYRLTFSDGTELCLVGKDGKSHRVFNQENGEFTYGSHFHVGQHSFKDDGSAPQLVSVELVNEDVEYYNVATSYHLNCFTNGILTSTGYNNMYPIEGMKFVKDKREIIPFETYEDIPEKFYNEMRLGEQDLKKRSVKKAKNYIGRLLKVMK